MNPADPSRPQPQVLADSGDRLHRLQVDALVEVGFRLLPDTQLAMADGPVVILDGAAPPHADAVGADVWLFVARYDSHFSLLRPAEWAGVLCLNPDTAWRLRRLYPGLRVATTEYPLMASVRRTIDRRKARQVLQLSEQKLSIFCTEETHELARFIASLEDDPRVALITPDRFSKLSVLNEQESIAWGLAACDVAICEPTAKRVAMAIRQAAPLVSMTKPTAPLFDNAYYLTERGAGLIARDGLDLAHLIDEFAAHRDRLQVLRQSMAALRSIAPEVALEELAAFVADRKMADTGSRR